MEQIIFGILLMILGITISLEQFGVIEVHNILVTLWPLLIFLIGLLMILRVQGRLASRRAERRGEKERIKLEKQKRSELDSTTKELNKKLENSEKHIAEAEQVIDDLVNPKQ